MRHYTTPQFWKHYERLPRRIQQIADKNYELLRANPKHPSLHFKKVGNFWSVRVGAHFRALGVTHNGGVLWFWIGSHADYDELID